MKHPSLRRFTVFPSIMMLLLLTTGIAKAESNHISFSNDTESTLIWCAIILAAGRIIAALISRRQQ